jgi:hypothetical protein
MPSRNGFYYNAFSTGNNICGFVSYVPQTAEEAEEAVIVE